MSQTTVTSRLLKNEIDAHVIAASFRGLSFVNSTGITCSNIPGLEGELYPKKKGSDQTGSKSRGNRLNMGLPKRRKKLNRGSGERVRKNLLKNRCDSFSRLSDSQRFLAFYTITFPNGFSDESCITCLNKWLTRIRAWIRKFPYLWVAERQKNGTIHFHLLTNRYLPIRVVNGFMAAAIRTELKRTPQNGVSFNFSRYNGVDVEHVRSPRHVSAYISKYLTKDLGERVNQKWHCSRLFAQLSVSMSIHQADVHRIISTLHNFQLKDEESIIAISNGHFLYIPLKLGPPSEFIKAINSQNETIYQQWKSQ